MEGEEELLHFYDDALEEFGAYDARALHWWDASGQLKRFEVLCEVADLSNKSILDVGCGLGDLYPYLTTHFKNVQYTGIDVSPRFITSAHAKYPDGTFKEIEFGRYEGPRSDVVLASGALTYKVPNHKPLYFSYIEKMYDLSTLATAFNMLDRRFHVDDETFAAYDIGEVEKFCKTFANHVIVKRDYLPQDFTVYLYR